MDNLLSIVTFLPLFGAIVLMFFLRGDDEMAVKNAKLLALFSTVATFIASLFVLRWRRPQVDRPYRATGYPLLPAIYIVSSVVAVVVMMERALSGEPGAWYPLLGLGAFCAPALDERETREGEHAREAADQPVSVHPIQRS